MCVPVCSWIVTLYYVCFLYNAVYEIAEIPVNNPNTISKPLFHAHVRDMHQNSDEGFEREFGVRVRNIDWQVDYSAYNAV